MNRIWIIEESKRSGRLCNRLGLFGHFVAYAIEHGDIIVNLNFSEYASDFMHIDSGIVSLFPSVRLSIPVNRLTLKFRQSFFSYLKLLPFCYSAIEELRSGEIVSRSNHFSLTNSEFDRKINTSRLVFCQGWRFRCYDLVSKHAQKVRDIFSMSNDVELFANQKIAKLRDKKELLIAVHVRRGDYKNHWNGRFHYTFEAYNKLMLATEELLGQQHSLKFIVFSDERLSEDIFCGLDVEFADGSAIQDLCLMSKCDYIMGPPSSFSNWASFYGNVPLWYIQKDDEKPQMNSFRYYLPLDIYVV